MIKNEYFKGGDNYSSEMTYAYNILSHYINYTKHSKYLYDLEELDLSQEYGGWGVEAMGMKKISVVGEKKDTSGPNPLCRMRMELPSQEKIPRATKIIRDLDRTRKKRYM